MARRPRKPPTTAALDRLYHRIAMNRLAQILRCEHPDVQYLSPEQHFSLHEFWHEVLTAGYKLYRHVPPVYADPIIKKKWEKVFPLPPK